MKLRLKHIKFISRVLLIAIMFYIALVEIKFYDHDNLMMYFEYRLNEEGRTFSTQEMNLVNYDLENYNTIYGDKNTIESKSYEYTFVEEEVSTFDSFTQVSYDVPLFTSKLAQEGIDEIVHKYYTTEYANGEIVNQEFDEQIVVQPLQDEIILEGKGNPGSFTGSLTGYGPDCVGCSGVVACKPYPNVQNGNIYFNDSTYGTLRIVAADRDIPCGTIVTIENFYQGDVQAIVLDRGSAITDNKMDLLFSSESETVAVGRQRDIQYTINRWGW